MKSGQAQPTRRIHLIRRAPKPAQSSYGRRPRRRPAPLASLIREFRSRLLLFIKSEGLSCVSLLPSAFGNSAVTPSNIGSCARCYRISSLATHPLQPFPFILRPFLRALPKPELPSPKVELSSPKVELSSPKVELSSPKVELSSPKVELSSPKVELSSPKPELASPNPELSSPTSARFAPIPALPPPPIAMRNSLHLRTISFQGLGADSWRAGCRSPGANQALQERGDADLASLEHLLPRLFPRVWDDAGPCPFNVNEQCW